jgi:hypothetical protein
VAEYKIYCGNNTIKEKKYTAMFVSFVSLVVLLSLISTGTSDKKKINLSKPVAPDPDALNEVRLKYKQCPPAAWMPPIRHRADLGYVLKHLGAKRGCNFLLSSLSFEE